MNSIPQLDENEQELNSSVTNFFKEYKVSNLLQISHAEKEKGVSALKIFRYLFCLIFSDRSMYMQIKTGKFKASFSKNTVYRFLGSTKTNWLRFTTMLSEMVANRFMRKLTDEKRDDVFIIDDTFYAKAGYKKSELVAKVSDHVTMKHQKGFRLLTLGWSDGNSFVPVNFHLMSSAKDQNVLDTCKEFDKRSIAGKRRKQARAKATDVLVDLLRSAIHPCRAFCKVCPVRYMVLFPEDHLPHQKGMQSGYHRHGQKKFKDQVSLERTKTRHQGNLLSQ